MTTIRYRLGEMEFSKKLDENDKATVTSFEIRD